MGPMEQMMALRHQVIFSRRTCAGPWYQILEVFLNFAQERGLDVDDNDKNHG